jgi:hypothetical protein
LDRTGLIPEDVFLANTIKSGPLDASIFRISPNLEHRIPDLEGSKPKIAFAGWFRTDAPICFREFGDSELKSSISQVDSEKGVNPC